MSATGGWLVPACGDCGMAHPPPETRPLLVFALMALFALLGVLILIWQRHRRGRPKLVTDQRGALAVMGELCPHGWQAEITLYGSDAPLPEDAPAARPPLVGVQWRLYAPGGERVAVVRRMWASTIDEALQKIVEDRRIDVELEQIESSAGGGEERF